MRIAYIGPFTYPSSNANSLRIKGISETLTSCGHQVIVCPGLEEEAAAADATEPWHSDFEIHKVNEYGAGFASSLKPGIRGLFLGDMSLKWLKSLPIKPNVVILYGTHLGYLIRLINYCKRESITLLLDIVEWYDPRHLPSGIFGPFAISNELSMRWAAPKADGLIVISSYLEKYYKSKNCNVLKIPPVFSEFPPRPKQLRSENNLLNLCYVGTPGKKEEFEILIQGVMEAVKSGAKLNMHIVGISLNEFKAIFPKITVTDIEFEETFKFYGRIDNEAARKIVASSDFLILLRRPLRFANAGFPFKISESMSLGTPVICNQFSDIPEYLSDGVNSYIIEALTSKSVTTTILRAALQHIETHTKLQINARATAINYFSKDSCKSRINQLILNCKI